MGYRGNVYFALKEDILRDFEGLKNFKVFKKIYDGRLQHYEKMFKLLARFIQKQYKKGIYSRDRIHDRSYVSGQYEVNITGNIFDKNGRFKPGGINALKTANYRNFRDTEPSPTWAIYKQHLKIFLTKMHRALFKTAPTPSTLKRYTSSFLAVMDGTQHVIEMMMKNKSNKPVLIRAKKNEPKNNNNNNFYISGFDKINRPLIKAKRNEPKINLKRLMKNTPTKRPLSSYMHFVKERRASVVKKHPNYTVAQVAKELGAQWRKLGNNNKAPYVAKSRQNKNRYKATKKATKKTNNSKPKRPLSSYMHFAKNRRANIVKNHPNYTVAQVAKELGAQWRKLGNNNKAPYVAKARQNKNRYNTEKKLIKKTNNLKKKSTKKTNNSKPKRALSSYMYFAKNRRANIVKNHPNYTVAQVAKELGAQWRKLGNNNKAPYVAKARQNKNRYNTEKKAMKNKAKQNKNNNSYSNINWNKRNFKELSANVKRVQKTRFNNMLARFATYTNNNNNVVNFNNLNNNNNNN